MTDILLNNSLLKINHIGVLVSSLDKARKFYGDILKLEEINRPNYSVAGIWYKLGETELHLMLCDNLSYPPVHPVYKTVQPHFAVSVNKDVFTKFIDYLESKYIEFVEDFDELNGVSQVFVYDYDRNMIEINNSQQ